MGKLQSSDAHHSMQNDLARSTECARELTNGCVESNVQKTFWVYAYGKLCFDDDSSFRPAMKLRCSEMNVTASFEAVNARKSLLFTCIDYIVQKSVII